MKLLKFGVCALGLAIAGQAPAATVLFTENWGFNPFGTGVAGALSPFDEMTYLGLSYTETNGPTSSPGTTFNDVGRIGATGFANDGSPIPGGMTGLGVSYELTAAYFDWTGSYGATTGSNTGFTFDAGGTLNIYIDTTLNYNSFATAIDGINIMSLSILVGAGNINFANPVGVDGNINIEFQVDSVAAGYWFLDTDSDGVADTDVADLLGTDLVLGFTDSNNNITNPGLAVRTDFINSTGFGSQTGPGDIYTLNDGSFHPGAVEVPEPGILTMLGLGLLGFFPLRRKA
jgi:hypothetical protein